MGVFVEVEGWGVDDAAGFVGFDVVAVYGPFERAGPQVAVPNAFLASSRTR